MEKSLGITKTLVIPIQKKIRNILVPVLLGIKDLKKFPLWLVTVSSKMPGLKIQMNKMKDENEITRDILSLWVGFWDFMIPEINSKI